MPEIIINVPKELEEEFKNIKSVYWQLAVERRIREQLEEVARIKNIVSRSQLTEDNARELADEVSKSLAKRFLKLKK